MPPKKADASKKTTEKVKQKIIEDKTFGLKNKKGAKQQKFIQQVAKQVTNKIAAKNPRDLLNPNEEREKKREEEKKKKEELTQLFKPVLQTVAKGVDPKSVVCVYFKQGICQKGDRCKFSHDLSKERKSEKRNIYEDVREGGDGKETMENWDEEKLEDVVNQKHGEDNKKKNQTQIVCKYFIEAVENKTYGWFWSCPNGESCMYRHALPPGFTLKSEMKKKDEEEQISLEMLIEKERASLGPNVTKVTLETFLAWKQRKLTEKKDEKKRQEEKKKNDYKLGFVNGLTGRDLFTFDPSLIEVDDNDDGGDDIDYKQRADQDEDDGQQQQHQKEIRNIESADYFSTMAREVDGSGTVATDDRFSYLDSMMAQEKERIRQRRIEIEQENAACGSAGENGEEEEEEEDGGEEGEEEDEEEDDDGQEENEEGGDDDDDVEEFKKSIKKLESATTSKKKDIQIDESLFNAEDLVDLDEELEKLDLE